MVTLNALRNCFVHRRGIVSELDINEPNTKTLSIKYVKPFVFVNRNEVEVEVITPMILHDGEVVKFRVKEEVKSFRVGEKITLTLQEFSYICFSCWYFPVDIANKLPKVNPTNSEEV